MEKNNTYGIYVGISPEAVEAASAACMEILNAKADQKTIRVALGLLSQALTAPNNTTISNCSIEMGEPKKVKK